MELTEISQSVSIFKISDGFCCDWSEDDTFYVITDDGLDVFHFKPDPKSIFPEFGFDKSFISPLVYYPTEHAGFDLTALQSLSKDETSTIFYNPNLLPQWKIISPMPIGFLKAVWSPAGLAGTKNCLLALLTNSGSVTLWEYQSPHWVIKVDISNHIINHLKGSNCLSEMVKNKNYFDEFMKRCKQLTSTSTAWSPSYYQDGIFISFLATSQRSGDVYIHRLSSSVTPNANQTANLEQVLHSTLNNIVSAHWMKLNENNMLLIIGDSDGLLECFQLKLDGDLQLSFVKQLMILPDRDQVKISSITTGIERTIVKNLGNLSITGINKLLEDQFIVSSYTGELNLCQFVTLDGDDFHVKCEKITTKIDKSCNTLYGTCLSRNAAICVLCLTPCVNTDRLFGKSTSSVVIYGQHEINFLDTVIKNQSKVLTEQWDFMDLSRISILKKTYHPKISLNLTKDTPIYNAKICLWTHIMLMTISADYTPEIKKQWFLYILISHVKLYVGKLISKYEESRILDNFDSTTLSLQVRFLKYHAKESKDDYGIDNVLKKVTKHTKLVLSDVVNECEWCEERLDNVECSAGHPRQYCCVTLQDLSNDSCLVCPLCKSNGHSRLPIDEQICSFCDSQFVPTFKQFDAADNEVNFPDHKFSAIL